MLPQDQEGARAKLADWLRVIHDVDGVRTTLVFDGQGAALDIERPFKDLTFSYLFTPSGVTADTIMEQLTAKADSPKGICVVTGDRVLQQTVLAQGGQVMDSRELDAWIRSCEDRMKRYL